MNWSLSEYALISNEPIKSSPLLWIRFTRTSFQYHHVLFFYNQTTGFDRSSESSSNVTCLKSHSWSLQPDGLYLLQTPRALFSISQDSFIPVINWKKMFYGHLWVDIMLLEARPRFFLDPLKTYLKQCLPHCRIPLHWKESKLSSRVEGMAGKGLCVPSTWRNRTL